MRRALILIALGVVAVVAVGCKDNSTENYQPPNDDRSPGGNAPRPSLGSAGGPSTPQGSTARKR